MKKSSLHCYQHAGRLERTPENASAKYGILGAHATPGMVISVHRPRPSSPGLFSWLQMHSHRLRDDGHDDGDGHDGGRQPAGDGHIGDGQ